MSLRRGFKWDQANSRLDIYVDGTVAARLNDAGSYLTVPAGGLTVTAGGLTVTAGGATVTAGDIIATAGDVKITAANLKLGAVSAFATTQPTSAAIFKVGTAPSGAATTTGALYTDGTVIKKIIAAGTASNVET